jgi:hypothetical protein
MLHQLNNLLMHLLSLLRVVVDLLDMLKAMRLDLTFDHEGMDQPLYMDQLHQLMLFYRLDHQNKLYKQLMLSELLYQNH